MDRFRFLPLLALLPVVIHLAPACSSNDTNNPPSSSAASTGTDGSGGTGGSGNTGGAGGAGGSGPSICETLSLPARPFSAGPYGTHRGDIADDFTVDLADMTTWQLKQRFSGCESYVFVPDSLLVSDLDPKSIWESDTDLDNLVKQSPQNVHYFFVSRKTADADALASTQAQQMRINTLLSALPTQEAAHWRERLHVVAKKAGDLGGWISGVLAGHGRIGFSIDRLQKIRGAGYLADVKRFDSQLDMAMKWPWESNLAYVAHDPVYFNAQATLQDRLDADNATVVKMWDGEVLMELADTSVMLPPATEMAAFDTLEVEVTQQCPDPDKIEIGNCGAWDYLANLYIADDPNNLVEIARFITSYHRETHWVVDISQMLPLLASGGQHAFRWSFAPSWNTQPTATRLSLRLSNKNKGMRPTQATYLYSGGAFNAMYNTAYTPTDVPIPAGAKKVELFVLVTGHGAGTNQCAEFCNHQHELTVNGVKHLKTFPMAGSQDKCMPNIENGMTPNQGGTWWYGRGGWCPGQQVDPWIVDVTADVVPGQTATVSYRGLFIGMDPPDNSGDITLTSYLVVHE